MATTTYPLTTVFTPPPSCFSVWTYEAATYNYVSSGILLQNAIKELVNTECFLLTLPRMAARLLPSFTAQESVHADIQLFHP